MMSEKMASIERAVAQPSVPARAPSNTHAEWWAMNVELSDAGLAQRVAKGYREPGGRSVVRLIRKAAPGRSSIPGGTWPHHAHHGEVPWTPRSDRTPTSSVRQSMPVEPEHDLVGRIRKQRSLVIQVVQAQAPRPGFQEHTRFLLCPTQTVRKTRKPTAPYLRLSSVRQHCLRPSVAVLWLRLHVNCKINIAQLRLIRKVAAENDRLRDSVQEGWRSVDVPNTVQKLS
jgi:hypothetical protein